MYNHLDRRNRRRAKANLKRLMPHARSLAARSADVAKSISAGNAFVEAAVPPRVFVKHICGIHFGPSGDGGIWAEFEFSNMPPRFAPFLRSPAPLASVAEAENWAITTLAAIIALASAGVGSDPPKAGATLIEVDDLIISVPANLLAIANGEDRFSEGDALQLVDHFRRKWGGRLNGEDYRSLDRAEMALLITAMISLLASGIACYSQAPPPSQ